MPDLVRYQVFDGPHAGEPTTERGEIERLARECQATKCQACLDSTVVETRSNVVRSSVPHLVTTARKLRDYLPPDPPRGPIVHTCSTVPRVTILPGGGSPTPLPTAL